MNLEFTKNPIIQQAQLVIHHPQGDRASVTFLMHINCLHSFFCAQLPFRWKREGEIGEIAGLGVYKV